MNQRYIIYCRKSTDEKDKQILSIESQLQELKEFARKENLQVVGTISESKSAKVPRRKEFNRLLQLIKSDRADGILAWHPDRLARNSIDGGKIIYLLDIGKLNNLKFPTFWFENTPQGKFMLNIAFGQSKYYVDNLSENVKRGNRQKLRQGIWPNKAPLGYYNDKQTKTIKVNLKTSKIIKKAFQLFARGNKSFTQVSNFLFAHGITRANGRPLHINQIRRTLTRRFYIGILDYGGERHKASHKCFISKELFDKAQRQMKKKDLSRLRRNGKNFPFLGLVKCKECGASITAEQHTKHYKRTNRTADYTYYRCTKKLGTCDQPYISQEILQQQFRKTISDVALPTNWAKKWLIWLEKDRKMESQEASQNLENIERQITEIDKKLNLLLDLFLDQEIGEKTYKQKRNQLFERKLCLQENKEMILKKGSFWLEPFEDFINCVSQAQKIARKENNEKELETILQRVGSNFFLKDKL